VTSRGPTAAEQREALEWIMAKAIEPLEVLALRGHVDRVELETQVPRLEAIRRTLTFLEQPWVIEALMKGPPR
jgi:hypothetical protein